MGAPLSQWEPRTPLKDFYLPSFDERGVRIWDARGTEAEIFPDTQRLHVRNLYVRLFDSPDGSTLKAALESPVAEFNAAENCLAGTDFIHVVGSLFTAVGGQWTFFGEDHSLILERDVQVFLETDVAALLATDGPATGSQPEALPLDGFTTLTSHSLEISDFPQGFLLHFTEAVAVQTDHFFLNCDRLDVEILAERPIVVLKEKITGEAVRQIRAVGHVCIEEELRHIHADAAELFPREGMLILSGNVSVEDADGTLKGSRIVVRQKDKRILVDDQDTVRQAISIDFDG
jgi:lipopolysaccharide export system protein LptA